MLREGDASGCSGCGAVGGIGRGEASGAAAGPNPPRTAWLALLVWRLSGDLADGERRKLGLLIEVGVCGGATLKKGRAAVAAASLPPPPPSVFALLLVFGASGARRGLSCAAAGASVFAGAGFRATGRRAAAGATGLFTGLVAVVAAVDLCGLAIAAVCRGAGLLTAPVWLLFERLELLLLLVLERAEPLVDIRRPGEGSRELRPLFTGCDAVDARRLL